jgi:hypothetical protein
MPLSCSESEIFRRLHDRDLNELLDKLIHGDGAPDAGSVKDQSARKRRLDGGRQNDSDHDDGAASSSP